MAVQGGERLAPPRATALHAAPRGGRVRADLYGLRDAAAALGDSARVSHGHGLESGDEMRSSTLCMLYIYMVKYGYIILQMLYITYDIYIYTYMIYIYICISNIWLGVESGWLVMKWVLVCTWWLGGHELTHTESYHPTSTMGFDIIQLAKYGQTIRTYIYIYVLYNYIILHYIMLLFTILLFYIYYLTLLYIILLLYIYII